MRSCVLERLAWTARSLVCVAFCVALRFLSFAEIWPSHSEIHVLMSVWLISSVPMRLVSALKMLFGSLAARSAAACEGGSGTFGAAAAAAGAAAVPLAWIGPMKRAPSAPRVSPSAPPSVGVAEPLPVPLPLALPLPLPLPLPLALPLATGALASLKLLGLFPSAAAGAGVPLGASRGASFGWPSAC